MGRVNDRFPAPLLGELASSFLSKLSSVREDMSELKASWGEIVGEHRDSTMILDLSKDVLIIGVTPLSEVTISRDRKLLIRCIRKRFPTLGVRRLMFKRLS